MVVSTASTSSEGEMWDAEYGAGLKRETSNNLLPHPILTHFGETRQKRNGEIIAFDFFSS